MIDRAIDLLQRELSAYIKTIDTSDVDVVVDNIGLLETMDGDSLKGKIVITVVNVEEETTLKNISPVKRSFSGRIFYENPPIFLNLYLLFTCNFFGTKYINALERLSGIIKFFQGRNSFNYNGLESPKEEQLQLKFTMELYTLTFEQINHLWGSLGGRQIPFVMYKLRLVALTDNTHQREVPPIEEINASLHPVN